MSFLSLCHAFTAYIVLLERSIHQIKWKQNSSFVTVICAAQMVTAHQNLIRTKNAIDI